MVAALLVWLFMAHNHGKGDRRWAEINPVFVMLSTCGGWQSGNVTDWLVDAGCGDGGAPLPLPVPGPVRLPD